MKENVKELQGFFQDTVPQHAAAERPIALLRLDGDLYDSTMVPLEHLYRFVAVGGWVVIMPVLFLECQTVPGARGRPPAVLDGKRLKHSLTMYCTEVHS